MFPKYLLVIVSIIIIVVCAYKHSIMTSVKEALTIIKKSNQQVILIGDSVLNNNTYVPIDKNVSSQLKKAFHNVFNYAKDGAIIQDCYEQINTMIEEQEIKDLDTSIIILSIGGNNLLNKDDLNTLFEKYKTLMDSLKEHVNRIFILNLYQPLGKKYEHYKTIIDDWNLLLKQQYRNQVIDIHSILTDPNDFVNEIEPSENGAKKISKKIQKAIFYH